MLALQNHGEGLGLAVAGDGLALTDDDRDGLRLGDADVDGVREGVDDAGVDATPGTSGVGVGVWDALGDGTTSLEGTNGGVGLGLRLGLRLALRLGDSEAVTEGDAVMLWVEDSVAEPCCRASRRLMTPPVLLYSPGLKESEGGGVEGGGRWTRGLVCTCTQRLSVHHVHGNFRREGGSPRFHCSNDMMSTKNSGKQWR